MPADKSAVFARLKSMLPPRSATAKAEYFSTSTALRGRLNGVSLANRGSALSLMREILREFNATPLGARERLSMLGVFEDATGALVDDARNETRDQAMHWRERSRSTRKATRHRPRCRVPDRSTVRIAGCSTSRP